MNFTQLQEIRHAMNIQFRYNLYKSPEFPFLPSMGINHIIQSFEAKEENVFVGVLHLWYENESGEISYHTKDKLFLAGYWKHERYDHPEDSVKLAIYIQKSKPYDEDKLVSIALKYQHQIIKKHTENIDEEQDLEIDDDELLN